MNQPTNPNGFTLIELLVVVTIIVILLALLIPAMEKAIYQAELTVCGARLKGVGTSVTTYAAASKRYFPMRLVPRKASAEPNQISTSTEDRPAIKKAINPLTAYLQCPLTGRIEMDNAIGVYAPTDLWFSWQFRNGLPEKGSNKMGDSFTWTQPTAQGNIVHRFDVLASDADIEGTNTQFQRVAHPDKTGWMANNVAQDRAYQGVVEAIKETHSWWTSNATRGPVDLNFAIQDGSVRRYVDLLYSDPRLVQVPAFSDGTDRTTTYYRQLPEGQ